MEQTIDLVAAGGRIVILGLVKKGQGITFPGLDFTRKEVTILGSRASVDCFPEALDLLASGKIHYPKIASSFALSEAPGGLRQTRRQSDGPAQGRLRFGGRMKLVTFSHRNGRHNSHAGVLDGDHVACLTEAGIAGSVLEIITGGAAMLERIRAGVAKAPRYPLADLILEAPVRPGKVLCSGINYKGHARGEPERQDADRAVLLRQAADIGRRPRDAGREAGAHRADGLRGRVLRRHRQARCTRPRKPT